MLERQCQAYLPCWIVLLSISAAATAQQPPALETPYANSLRQPLQGLPTQTLNTLSFYGVGSTRAGTTLSQIPRSSRPAARLPASAQFGSTRVAINSPRRTFASSLATMPPAVSPYQNLYREENDDSPPNYYSLVRPQLHQIEVNQVQQRENRRLQQQLRQLSTQGQRSGGSEGPYATGHGTRFMNLGGYYPSR